jgi:hypothetical protein
MTSVTIGAGSAYLSVAPPGYRVGVAKSFFLYAVFCRPLRFFVLFHLTIELFFFWLMGYHDHLVC